MAGSSAPRQREAYDASAGVIDPATALTAGLMQNHPCIDGKRRPGVVAGILFIELNGYVVIAADVEAAEAVPALAAGAMNEAGYTAFLRDHVTRAPAQAPAQSLHQRIDIIGEPPAHRHELLDVLVDPYIGIRNRRPRHDHHVIGPQHHIRPRITA